MTAGLADDLTDEQFNAFRVSAAPCGSLMHSDPCMAAFLCAPALGCQRVVDSSPSELFALPDNSPLAGKTKRLHHGSAGTALRTSVQEMDDQKQPGRHGQVQQSASSRAGSTISVGDVGGEDITPAPGMDPAPEPDDSGIGLEPEDPAPGGGSSGDGESMCLVCVCLG
eukprot:332693-Pelagomonas_calceolata.AAC.1